MELQDYIRKRLFWKRCLIFSFIVMIFQPVTIAIQFIANIVRSYAENNGVIDAGAYRISMIGFGASIIGLLLVIICSRKISNLKG